MQKQVIALERLCLYKDLGKDSLLKQLKKIVERESLSEVRLCDWIEEYNGWVCKFMYECPHLSLVTYIKERVLYGDHLIDYLIEQGEEISEALKVSLAYELKVLEAISRMSSTYVKEHMLAYAEEGEVESITSLIEWKNEEGTHKLAHDPLGESNWAGQVEALITFYNQYGCGQFAKYHVFYWDHEKGLQGVKQTYTKSLEDLVGYQLQKEELLHNTTLFVNNKTANNVLLYGARGTGKSSMVKGLLNHKEVGEKLRLIEIKKDQLMTLKHLFDVIRYKPYRFILFIDDLMFEEENASYTFLKTMLEGGIDAKPSNTLVYATSNRRHIIKEWHSDNELHANESADEKISLSDRFGVRIYFGSPDQNEYLEIVKGLAKQSGIEMEEKELERKAIQWEMWHNGRSGRTAEQFINSL